MRIFIKKHNTKCDLCLELSKIENKCITCNYSMCKECFDKYIDYGYDNCAHCRNELHINLEINQTDENNKCICKIEKYKKYIYDFVKSNTCVFYVIFSIGFMISLYFLGYSITKNHEETYILNFFLGLIIFLIASIVFGMIYNILCMN